MECQGGKVGVLRKGFLVDKQRHCGRKKILLFLLNVIIVLRNIRNSGSHFVTMRAQPEMKVNPQEMAKQRDLSH